MTKDEALKLALEALESCDAAHITDGGHQWYDEKLVDKAITAIEKCLANNVVDYEPEKTVCPFCSSEWVTAEQHDRKMDRIEQEPCCYGGIAHDCHAGEGCRIADRLKAAVWDKQK